MPTSSQLPQTASGLKICCGRLDRDRPLNTETRVRVHVNNQFRGCLLDSTEIGAQSRPRDIQCSHVNNIVDILVAFS